MGSFLTIGERRAILSSSPFKSKPKDELTPLAHALTNASNGSPAKGSSRVGCELRQRSIFALQSTDHLTHLQVTFVDHGDT
jgi:hypothetical protein